MSLDLRVSALTAELRSEFWKAWDRIAEPAPYEKIVTRLKSTTLVENYINGTPVPGLKLWQNGRSYNSVDTFVSSIRNSTFHTEISATLEQLEDDQTTILKMMPADMVQKAKLYPGRAVFQLIGQALGSPIALQGPVIGSFNAFDGQPFFGNRVAGGPGFGTGQNLFTYKSQNASDTNVYNLVAFYTGNSMLKPLGWQDRSGPDFRTTSGTESSYESRVVKWWVDLRGAPFFTYFWNSCACQIIGLPNVAEMNAIYSQMEAYMRKYQYPKTSATEWGEYVHEQTIFGSSNLVLAGSSQLAEQIRASTVEDWIPQNIGTNTVATNNTRKGFAEWMVTTFLDTY
jgi:phage major head subunit gpT-like protein